ncbi:MAG: helix-turn-helix transcriptional regulator [Verrucomicrobia bacterium]|uniref:helix-turn-helix domain-containing protein n=1 Tax=Accumulibacter sp. TaxID=2053492 RepID=UPI001AC6D85C|nr:helix-turn-helix transcriptional regulator [Accumulibacter sp.]MBN8456705.1 helix-turn-helix transcriptional regulator [Verrucomicrobiota bacterium]
MDKISAFTQRNPVALAREVGQRIRAIRLAKGWTREELAERSGVAVSTLKLLESKGQGSFQRLTRVAVALGVDGEIRSLFSTQPVATSIEALKRAERRRAPRRIRKAPPSLPPSDSALS